MPAREVGEFIGGRVVSALAVRKGVPTDSAHPDVAAQAFNSLVGNVPNDELAYGMDLRR
jgi:hypothetical protein